MLWLIKHQTLPQDLPAGNHQRHLQQRYFPALPAPVCPEQPPTSLSLPRLLATAPSLGDRPGIPRTSQLDGTSPQQTDREAPAALWPLPHLCHHKDTNRQQWEDFSNQREPLLLNQAEETAEMDLGIVSRGSLWKNKTPKDREEEKPHWRAKIRKEEENSMRRKEYHVLC